MNEFRWQSEDQPKHSKLTARRWPRVIWRGLALCGIVFGGLAILLLVRVAERPIFGRRRPWTPYITQRVCKTALRLLNLRLNVQGDLLRNSGAAVANHTSWLDIVALNASVRLYFVSKSEVANWPGIGWLARATGTVFVRRTSREAALQKTLIHDRLEAGHHLLFFPEGTSTDGLQVLPFKSTLFEAFFNTSGRGDICIQPITVSYLVPSGKDPRFYGWWGDMEFATHLFAILAVRNPGAVNLTYHAPLRVADYSNRKALALACEDAVRAGLPAPRSKPS